MTKLLDELIEVTKQLSEVKRKEIELYIKQEVILVKLNKKWKNALHTKREHNDNGNTE